MRRGVAQYCLGVLACLAAAACYQPGQAHDAYVPKTQAVALMEEALAAVQAGNPEKALDLLDKAIAVDPGFAAPYKDRAMLLAQDRRFDDAIASLDEAIERGSDPGEALLAKGILLEISGKETEAKTTYAAAIEALALPPADPANDLRRRIAWAHAQYLRDGMPAGVRAINDVAARYPEHPLVEMYRRRILSGRREALLGVHLVATPQAADGPSEDTQVPEKEEE